MGEYVPSSKKRFNVLVTGFGPFRYTPVNPSWEVAKLLTKDGNIHTDDIIIDIDATYIPVQYDYISQALKYYHGNTATKPSIPDKHMQNDIISPRDDSKRIKQYDLFLHIGQGRSGGIQVETCGHQLGYRLLDAAGRLAPEVSNVSAQDEFAETPEQSMSWLERDAGLNRGYALTADIDMDQGSLTTSYDTQSLSTHLQKTYPDFRITKSINAGRYLCEFIYFASMAEAEIAHQALGQTLPKPKVLFVHIPPANDPLSLEDVRSVIESLLIEVSR